MLSKSPTVTETDKFVSEMRRKTPKPVSGKWIAASSVRFFDTPEMTLVAVWKSGERATDLD